MPRSATRDLREARCHRPYRPRAAIERRHENSRQSTRERVGPDSHQKKVAAPPASFFSFYPSSLSRQNFFSSSSQDTLSIIISSKSFHVLVCLIVVLLYTLFFFSHSFFSSPTFSSLPRGFPECLSTREVSMASLVILIALD